MTPSLYPIDCSDVDVDFVRASLDRVVYQSTPLISLPAIYNLPLPLQAITLGGINNTMGGQNITVGGINNTIGGQNNIIGGINNTMGGQIAPRMVSRCASECIDTPDDAPGSYMYPTHHEKLLHRFVAVVKVGG